MFDPNAGATAPILAAPQFACFMASWTTSCRSIHVANSLIGSKPPIRM